MPLATLNWLFPRILLPWTLLLLGLLLTFPTYSSTPSAEASAAELNQQLQELNQHYEKLKKQIKESNISNKKSLRAIKKQKQTLQFRGFFSAGVATSDSKAALRKLNDNQNIGDEPNFQSDSIVGLQLDATINNKTRYTHQMTTAGFDINHRVKTEWAYFSYKPFNETIIKVGRLRIPFFLLSESLDVGLSYPWVRPPIEIYTIPITGYEGIDVGQKFNLGRGFVSTHLFFGSGLNTLSAQLNVDFSVHDLRGFSVDYNLDDWLFRFSYTTANGSFSGNIECDEASVITAIATVIGGATFDQSSVECGGVDTLIVGFDAIDTIMMNAGDPSDLFVSLLQSPEDWSLQYINLALRYDDGSSLVIAEYGEAEFNKWFNPIGPSGYVLYGYRLGKWLPYISIGNLVTSPKTRQMVDTMAERITKSNSPLLGVSAAASLRQLFVDTGTIIKTRSYTVGINYWINNNMRSKLEIAHYERHKGTNGAFVTNPGSHNAVYSFAVDGLF